MKLFIYQNNWNFISIAKIHMQELKKNQMQIPKIKG